MKRGEIEKKVMEAKDLMIGDWVNETYEAVDGNMYEQEKRVGYYDLNDVKYFTPIPITPEILTKNGFVQAKDWYLCKLSDKDSKISIAYSDLYLDIRRTNPIMTIMVQCMYVHELQHALKLCGIDKEIKL